MEKYKSTNETVEFEGVTYCFVSKNGDLGGFIEYESSLSHNVRKFTVTQK